MDAVNIARWSNRSSLSQPPAPHPSSAAAAPHQQRQHEGNNRESSLCRILDGDNYDLDGDDYDLDGGLDARDVSEAKIVHRAGSMDDR